MEQPSGLMFLAGIWVSSSIVITFLIFPLFRYFFAVFMLQGTYGFSKNTKGVFTWIRIEFQSGSNSFRFSWDHRGLNYICLHESGLSCNSFRIEFIPFLIPDWILDPEWNVDSESCKLGSKFHSWMKYGMKSTFIMAEIKIVCKIQNEIFIPVIFQSSTQSPM